MFFCCYRPTIQQFICLNNDKNYGEDLAMPFVAAACSVVCVLVKLSSVSFLVKTDHFNRIYYAKEILTRPQKELVCSPSLRTSQVNI